jgi:hypothetical protein
MRHLTRFALVAAMFAGVAVAAPAYATPPSIPSASTAQSELNVLTVAAQGSMTGYSRDLFPHWITISGTCNTRETVLERDGTSVVTDSSCAAISGRWYSPYDGATWFAASDVDIDHVVPLAEAWRRCTYARMWIGVKYCYGLTLQSSEKSALQTMLNSC